MKSVLLSWSSGKDSAWTLGRLLQDPEVQVAGLLTTINESANRVAMHAVRRDLLEAQAQAVGLPLWAIPLPSPCSNEAYERIMEGVCRRAVEEGVEAIAFGDLFLSDVRRYRERQLQGTGLEPLFPVWGIPTGALAAEMIAAGLRAKITCVDPRKLDRAFAGREFDAGLLADLPAGADPCGENGEFHSFVYCAPEFEKPLPVRLGEIVERDGFVFADVLLDCDGATERRGS
jgi:uncharacterized protein (TIGR00290 family)